jgi:uncharacterized repeat protein (TIGR01451 family)
MPEAVPDLSLCGDPPNDMNCDNVTATPSPGPRRSPLAAARAVLVSLALVATATRAQASITITRTSSDVFYISSQAASNNIRNMYAAYRITNTGATAETDVWVKLDTFTGGVVSLATQEDGLYRLYALGPGESKMAYLYLTASGQTATPQSHSVRVYDHRPGLPAAVELTSQVFTLTKVQESLSSGSNKVDLVIEGPDPGVLGGTITLTVTGRTGSIGAGSTLEFTAAAYPDWPADVFELYRCEFTLYDVSGSNCGTTPLGTFADQLSVPWSTTSCYTAVYKVRARDTTPIPTVISPTLHAASGANYKHTDPSSIVLLSPIAPVDSKLRLVKSVSEDTVLTGDQVTYTMHVTSGGSNGICPPGDPGCNDPVFDNFVDVLPTSPGSATYVPGSARRDGSPLADPVISGSTLTWTGAFTFAAGGSTDITYDVAFPSVAGSYTNSAVGYVADTPVDTTLDTNDNAPGQAAVLVRQPSDLVLTHGGPATVNPLGSIAYTVRVLNQGPRPASGVAVRDTLPAGVSFVSASNGGTEAGGVVSWPAVASIAVGDSVVFTATVTAPASGILLAVASCSPTNEDPDPSNNDGSAPANRVTTTVLGDADLALVNSGPATVNAAQSFNYTVAVSNNGPANAAAVVVRDTLPAGVTFVSADNGGSETGGVVTWPPVALANGNNLAYTVTVTAPASGTLLAVARADADNADPDTTNNNGSAPANRVMTVVTELADLALAKSGPAVVLALGSITYTLSVTNNGPSDAAAVVVQDTLPAGVTFVSADNGGTEAGGIVTWPAAASLANGANLSYSVTVTAPATGTLLNVARADASTVDPDTTNNNGSAPANRVTTTVTELADLAVTKSGPATVNAAQSFSYTVSVANSGPDNANAVVVQDTLPVGVTFVSADNGGTEAGGIVTWPAVGLPSGDNLTYTVTVTAPATGTLLNVARADASTADPDTTNNNGSAPTSRVTTTVVEQADLALSKSGPATVNASGSVAYTLSITNNGPSDAAAVVVQDTLPAGVTFVSADNGGTEAGGIVTWPAVASLANGANLSYSVTVTAPATGTLLNVARADAVTVDPDTTNNNGSAPANRVTTTVTELADLALNKSGPAAVTALGSITYTLSITNNGPSDATAVVVRDTLPAGVTFVSADNGGAEAGGVVTWPAQPSLANGANLSYSVTVVAPATGTLLNVARADASTMDPDTTNNNGSAPANRVTTVVGELADLATAKSGPATVNALGSVTYTVSVTNNGPSVAAAVVVRDTLPASVAFVSADNGGTEAGGIVTWPAVALLANGANMSYSVTVTAPATGTLLNVARADAVTIDPDTTNNNGSAPASRVTTTVADQADLALNKSGPAGVNALGSITYTLSVTNNGPSDASAVVVRDTLPAGVTFVSADNGGTESGGIVTWPAAASLANAANLTYSVTVTAPATGTLLNVARADAGTADPDTTNNNGSAPANRVTTVVGELADLTLNKSGPAAVNALGLITYTVSVTNNGPSDAAAVVVRDTLPTGVTFVSADNGGSESGGIVTWPAVATFANGANLAYSVTVIAPATGTLLNVARADASTTDPDTTNNNGSAPANRVTTIVGELADLALAKSGPASVNALGSITYSVSVTNNGPSDAAAVVVRDTLPPGVTFVSADNGGIQVGGIVTWPVVASLGNGANLTYSVTVVAPATGTLLNVARADAVTADPDTTNNNGSAPANRVTTTVTELADLALAKSGPATVNALGSISYSVSVTNNGPSDAAAVVVRDTLPAGVTFLSANNGGTESGGVVTWPAVATLANGSSLNYSVTVVAPAAGTLINVARADASTADPDTANNNGSAPANRVTTTVGELADLALTKSGPASVNALGLITYTLSVVNNGPSAAAAVVMRDTLPAGVTFVSADNGGTQGAGIVTWPAVATLANGANLSYSVTVIAPATGTLLNVARADAATTDPDTTNNNGSAPANRVTTTVGELADLALSKSGPSSVNALGSITYTVSVTNNGPSAAAAVVVRDTLPAGVTFLSADNGGLAAGGVVTWPPVASLANGANLSYSVTVTAPATGTLVNIASASSGTPDPNAANNDGSAPANRVTTVVGELADLALTKTGPATINALGSISYSLSVTNNGPSNAAAVVVRDTLPAGATFVSADNGGTMAGGIVTWPVVASLANGASTTYSVTVTAPNTGTLLNVGAATSSTTDPNPANNNGSAPANRVTTVVSGVDLAIEMSHTGQFYVGQTGLYTITVRNVGVGTANTTITVTDTLPAGLTFASVTRSAWNISSVGQIVTCTTPGPLAPGGTIGFTLAVNVDASAVPSVTNSATVSNVQDSDPANNRVVDQPAAVILDVALTAQKTASRSEVEIADVVDYTVTIRNQGTTPVNDLVITDVLPTGFMYRGRSARFDGAQIVDPTGAPGPSLSFAIGTLANGASGVLTYRVEVGPGATLGNGVNRAYATSAAAGAASNQAAVQVRVRAGVFTDEGTIAGKVYLDCDCSSDSLQGAEELGVPGVRVVLEDGSAAITDVEGKYHFVGVNPRLHAVRIDRTTLPAPTHAVTMSNRQAGDGWSQFVDLKAGELFRADFALSQTPELLGYVQTRRAHGEVEHPVSVDPTLGAQALGAAASATARALPSPGSYRGLLESRPDASAARSAPLAGETPVGPAPFAQPIGLTGMTSTHQGLTPTLRGPSPSLLALGVLQGRLELWSRANDAVFTHRGRFESELRDFSASNDAGRLLAGARGAIFLTGPVAHDYHATVRYDSERDPQQRFFKDIRPDEHYSIYGDASVAEFLAQSRSRVYAKLERGRSFLEYGDMSTATTNPLLGLGGFHRVLNGGRSHVEWAKGAIEAFGSRGLSRQVVDELPALGISGPYTLSRTDGLINSEQVEILTRDRSRPSVIVERRPQQRFLDYSVEPFTGRIVFQRSVPSVDENLNPISIRVTYESESGGERAWVYGAQGSVRPVPQIEIGGSAVREDDPLADRTILSANGAVDVVRGLTALGEFAHSDSAGATGNAARGEIRAARTGLDLNLFGMRTGMRFSNPSAGYGPARDELGARTGWQAVPGTRLFGEALYSKDRIGGGHRSGGQLGITQRLADRITGELAFRASEETASPASPGTAVTAGATPNDTRSLRARLTDQLSKRASVFGEYEQDLEDSDQRRAAVGGDLLVASRTRAYGRYELISSFAGPYALNTQQERTSAVVGVSSDDTPAGTVFSEYRLRDAIGGREAQAAIGLRNRWMLSQGFRLDASAERVAPVRGGGGSQNAAGFGVDYTAPDRWRGTGRLEWRRASGDDQLFGSLGYAHKLARDWALLSRGSANVIDRVRMHGSGQLGVAWRQTDQNRWNGLARLETRYDRDRNPTGRLDRTTVTIGSVHLDYQPLRSFQFRGQVATRVSDVPADVATANATLFALRGTWDFYHLWDGGLVGRTLFADRGKRRQDGLGAEVGFAPLKNLRLATGYNLLGYADGDLNGGSRSEHGVYLDVGFKLNEDVFRFLNPGTNPQEPEHKPVAKGGQQ